MAENKLNIWGKGDIKAVEGPSGNLEGFLKISGSDGKHEVKGIHFFLQSDSSRKNIFLNFAAPFFYGSDTVLKENYKEGMIPSFLSLLAYRRPSEISGGSLYCIPLAEMYLPDSQRDTAMILFGRAERQLPFSLNFIKPIGHGAKISHQEGDSDDGFSRILKPYLMSQFPEEMMKVAIAKKKLYAFSSALAAINLSETQESNLPAPKFSKNPIGELSAWAKKYARMPGV